MKNEIRGRCHNQEFEVKEVLHVCGLSHSHTEAFFLVKAGNGFNCLSYTKSSENIHCFQYSVCIQFWYLKEMQLT